MINISKLIDVRQTSQYAKFMEKIGWKTIKVNNVYIYLKKLPLLNFSVVKILRAKKLIKLNKIKKLLKKYHPLFIKIQPFTITKNYPSKFTPPRCNLTPSKTCWINLKLNKKQLLKNMKPKTRYNIRLAKKRGVKVKITPGNKITNNQLKNFYNLWKKNKPFNFLFQPSFNELKSLVLSFKEKCFFIFAFSSLPDNNCQLLSGLLIITSPNMAFYWHNCSSKKGKKLMAPTLSCWQAIIEAKKRKLSVFDFEGVWDKRLPKKNKGWQGFSRFKKSFGGQTIEFPLFIN